MSFPEFPPAAAVAAGDDERGRRIRQRDKCEGSGMIMVIFKSANVARNEAAAQLLRLK